MNKHTDPYKSDFQRINRYENIGDFIKDSKSYGDTLFLDGKVVTLKYNPPKWKYGMKCWCLIWRGLKPEETVSSSWCHCAKGLITEHWKEIAQHFNQDVKVEMECSCISGGAECEFKIHLA
ncbi:MAG: hypothetical protein ACFFB5_22940 [Promethearchaeota archaeon]